MTAKLTMLVGKYWNSMEVPRKLKKIIPRKHEYLQRYLDVLGIYWNALWRRERPSLNFSNYMILMNKSNKILGLPIILPIKSNGNHFSGSGHGRNLRPCPS